MLVYKLLNERSSIEATLRS